MPAFPESIQIATAAARAAEEKQAQDLVVLDVADMLALVDLFVIVTARTDRQLKAVVDEIEHRLREDHDRRPLRREGVPESGWVLLDYGDVVCHLFDEEQRAFYMLERLWADVPRLDPLSGDPETADAVAR